MPAHLFVAARLRAFFARHPWIYWSAVGALAAGVAVAVSARLDAVDAARASWEDTRPVLVARHGMAPDDPIAADAVELPIAAIPVAALEAVPDGARARRVIRAGEVLVDVDVVAALGPARHAASGRVVVGVVDPLSPGASIGIRVAVVADGRTVATDAVVVDVVGDVVFVEVDPHEGPAVAVAALEGRASLLFVP